MERTGMHDYAHKALLLAVVIGPLLATGYAIYRLWNSWVTWLDLALLVGMWVVSGLGITVGFHRMLTHRGFTAPVPVRVALLGAGTMALQGPPTEWAATHVKHHAKSDREGDPHSPLEGFWHAHVGWLFRNRVIRDGPYAAPFKKDPATRFVDRTWLLWAALGFAIPFAIGGWTGLLWGGLVRVGVGHHITWSVNSVCHTFGKRTWETPDASRNQWIVGLLAFGEGWHNNHHAQPASAFHGFRWWQVDTSAYVIRTLEKIGVARDVVRPRPEVLRPAGEAHPDGDGQTTSA